MKTLVLALFPLLLSAQNAVAQSATGGAREGITPFLPLILIFGVFYFLILRPQQKKAKDQQKFLSELKRGDMIVTASGIIGVIRTLSDKFVTLEIDEGVCMKVLRSQVLESANNLKEESKGKASLFAQPQEDKNEGFDLEIRNGSFYRCIRCLSAYPVYLEIRLREANS